ncbi:PTS galactitol transporter subunit IIC [Clostridium sediminicola]|uniref:PTS transporter subunit IIC n=1 Tax=Clostridium sediminicola TaxID=3114879 RepID=UPI0031F2305B
MNIAAILGSLGGPVLVAIVMFILGLIFRASFKNSLRGGIYAGIGLAGLFVIINNATATLTPAIQAFSERFNTSLTVTDVGWGSAGIAFSWPGLALVIVAIIIVNIIMIFTGLTKTMWTDIWSYWHGQVVGGFVWYATGSVILGVIAAVIFLVIGSWVADATAKKYQEFNGLPGISVPCAVSLLGIFAQPFNALIDKIPGLRDINASPENIRKRMGIFGELGVMGVVIGVAIGILAGYDYAAVLNLGIQIGVLMIFLPKAVSVLCEGVIPIANAVNEFVQDRFEGKELYVGVDCAALVGHPSVMASAVLVYPLAVILALLLPGNGMIPIASLAIVPYWCGAAAPQLKGNVFRIVLFTLVWMIPAFYIATAMAPVHTGTMAALGLSDANVINSSFDMGGDLLGFIITKIFSLFT